MTERLAALEAQGGMEFWGNKDPKCPHCASNYDVQEREAWQLYEEGEHEIECPSCDLPYMVRVNVSFTYTTDEQPDADED